MKTKPSAHLGLQDLCRKLKLQLDDLGRRTPEEIQREAEAARQQDERHQLMERLKQQLSDLST